MSTAERACTPCGDAAVTHTYWGPRMTQTHTDTQTHSARKGAKKGVTRGDGGAHAQADFFSLAPFFDGVNRKQGWWG